MNKRVEIDSQVSLIVLYRLECNKTSFHYQEVAEVQEMMLLCPLYIQAVFAAEAQVSHCNTRTTTKQAIKPHYIYYTIQHM